MKVQKSKEKKATATVRKKRAPSNKVAVSKPAAESLPTEAPGKHYVTVDYPQEGEIVTSGHYSFRLSTSALDKVEVSIDGKEWEPCRECVGFWWYDWSGYGAGVHTIVSRITAGKRAMKSKARSFTVII